MWVWVNILTYLSFIICEMGLCVISTLSKLIILSTQKSAGAHALNNHSLLIFYRQCAMPVLASSLNKIQNFEFNLFLSDCIIMRVYGCFDFSYVQIYQGTICAVVSTFMNCSQRESLHSLEGTMFGTHVPRQLYSSAFYSLYLQLPNLNFSTTIIILPVYLLVSF